MPQYGVACCFGIMTLARGNHDYSHVSGIAVPEIDALRSARVVCFRRRGIRGIVSLGAAVAPVRAIRGIRRGGTSGAAVDSVSSLRQSRGAKCGRLERTGPLLPQAGQFLRTLRGELTSLMWRSRQMELSSSCAKSVVMRHREAKV